MIFTGHDVNVVLERGLYFEEAFVVLLYFLFTWKAPLAITPSLVQATPFLAILDQHSPSPRLWQHFSVFRICSNRSRDIQPVNCLGDPMTRHIYLPQG